MVTSRALLSLCLSLTSLAACGGDASSTPPTDAATTPIDTVVAADVTARADTSAPETSTTDAPAVGDATLPADVCTPYCARVVGAMGCMRDTATCMRDCATQLSVTPAACRPALSAWFACALTATASCTGMVTRFSGCEDAQTALVICAAMPPDGGTDPCARKIDCGGCVANAACGWCNAHCIPGNATGPETPALCAGQPWVRNAAMCR
jgi:hypothetical protein